MEDALKIELTIEPGENAAAGELSDEALDAASGGISLLLPAVQKVRESANRFYFEYDGLTDKMVS